MGSQEINRSLDTFMRLAAKKPSLAERKLNQARYNGSANEPIHKSGRVGLHAE